MEPNQTPTEPNFSTNVTNQSKLAEVIAPLHRATLVSKILAAVVMIILPFAGFWVGYTYAPGEVVDLPLVVVPEVTKLDDLSDSEIDNSSLRQYVDGVFGFTFEYPAKWGEVTFDETKGICKDESDPCLERIYRFENILGDKRPPRFLVAQKNGFSYPEAGDKGASWGSFAGDVTDDFLTKCSTEASCKIITSDTNLKIAAYYIIAEMGTEEKNFVYEIFKSDLGVGMVFSSARFSTDVPGSESEFQDTVIKSLEFLERY